MQVKLWTIAAATSALVFAAIGMVSTQRPVHAMEAVGHVDDHADDVELFSRVCVFGWSKDTCVGELVGDVSGYTCSRVIDGQTVLCRTVHVRNAVLKIPVRQNPGGCSTTSRCDETPHLDGTLYIFGEFIFRIQGDCPYRGSWEGDWRLVDLNGQSVAHGTGSGTLGTGSHRPPPLTCAITPFPMFCSPDCEKCYDVTRSSSGGQTIWHVGLEGALRGQVVAGQFASSTVSITLSGMLNSLATASGQPNFASWRYCGASDGVVLAKCSPILIDPGDPVPVE